MKHLGLFEGIGGFSLAARWMGWDTVAWCEWNDFGQQVLGYHFPKAKGFSDITKTDFTEYANKIDIITGGFPCQPYSMAGKRKGKDDERHLWPEMLRAIREVQPSYVVAENVGGLVNWSGGLVFDEVQVDLEAEGYEVQPFILPACAVNAPHRRDRVWFIAYRNKCTKRSSGEGGELEKEWSKNNDVKGKRGEQTELHNRCINVSRNASYNKSKSSGGELQPGQGKGKVKGKGQGEKQFAAGSVRTDWQNFPTQSPICGGDDGLPSKLDGITFSKWRNESIKAYGNAIVPQVAFEIFKAIEKLKNTFDI